MANQQAFQFTLGPVQGFVAQARRTRDFWAGSFILSWLSGVAIHNIQKQGGNVLFPTPDSNYLAWLDGSQPNGKPPLQGGLPNRFKAMTATVPTDFQATEVTDAVRLAWAGLCQVVWDADLAAISTDATKAIWDRQIHQFWEISWVLSDEDEPQLLDRRKNWRHTLPPDEPGHKCMMMDGWQELSGITHTRLSDVNNFWDELRDQMGGIDLRAGEHLCAMAFVKRRFARHFHNVTVNIPGTQRPIFGWPVPVNVPSIAFMAAAPWIARVIDTAPDAFEQFYRCAKQSLNVGLSEITQTQSNSRIDILCVSKAAQKHRNIDFHSSWAGLDGQIYFPEALQNPRLFDNQIGANTLLRELHKLRQHAGLDELPSPYYAVLMMDGDQLGQHMGTAALQPQISAALNDFTHQAATLVHNHNGFLIYAGGDDVLALFPLENALPAAQALQACYRACFKAHAPSVNSTLSGAIEFAHYRTPLTTILKDAHQLLDDVAKEATGRNAIAVRVWKPSGLALEWRMPWDKALVDNTLVLDTLAQRFRDGDAFSNSFVYRLQQIIERASTLPLDSLKALIHAEYQHSFGRAEATAHTQDIELLLDQCVLWHRIEAQGELKSEGLQADTALLMRFLVQKGLDKEFT